MENEYGFVLDRNSLKLVNDAALCGHEFEWFLLYLNSRMEMVTFRFHQYQVVGRALPTESEEHPKIFRMKLWATNEVRAKSKFWYFLRKLKKVKKSNGQVLAINEVLLELARIRNKNPLLKSIAGSGIPLPPEEDTLISPNYQFAIPKKHRPEAVKKQRKMT
ncbi:hypothetical protein IFM89_007515 [Coptis chinensis]|uniref:Ribosomal protein 50S-L18Ae/60S-L20/60S-L18A domain-containing protein n=1 Tax=Coptis chinensis TaxID=261450 RepID=A0A835HZX6_9MAGN|nr:hypothetical protein IFM89_007515 [Coptis chinensis]